MRSCAKAAMALSNRQVVDVQNRCPELSLWFAVLLRALTDYAWLLSGHPYSVNMSSRIRPARRRLEIEALHDWLTDPESEPRNARWICEHCADPDGAFRAVQARVRAIIRGDYTLADGRRIIRTKKGSISQNLVA